jgi:hypothetical protein
MSTQPSRNKLPLSYSLPPPPPSSSAGKGIGRGRGKGRGSGRFQPLFRQNNQPGLNQQNSQLFYSDNNIKDELLPQNVEKNQVSHELDLTQNHKIPSKKQKKNTLLKSSTNYEKLINNHNKLLIENYSSQNHFASLLDSFNKSIFDNLQNLQKSFEEESTVFHPSNNSSSDKYQNLSSLNENQESLNKININGQAIPSRSNFSQTKRPIEQNSKITSSRSTNASSNQLKKPNDEQGGSTHDKDYQVNFAAVAKAALAATSALQYKDQNADDKHNSAQSNNLR